MDVFIGEVCGECRGYSHCVTENYRAVRKRMFSDCVLGGRTDCAEVSRQDPSHDEMIAACKQRGRMMHHPYRARERYDAQAAEVRKCYAGKNIDKCLARIGTAYNPPACRLPDPMLDNLGHAPLEYTLRLPKGAGPSVDICART
jgi:hypothetical protein